MLDVKKLKELIVSKSWTAASTPAQLGTCYPWVYGFLRMRKYFPVHPTAMWLLIREEMGFQGYYADENHRILKQLFDKPKQTKKAISEWRLLRDRFLKGAEEVTRDFQGLSNQELAEAFKAFLDNFIETWAAPLAVDNMETYTEHDLLPRFSKVLGENERKNAHEYFAALCQPSLQSFVAKEHLSLITLALLYKRGDSEKFADALSTHQRNFYWVQNSYKEIKVLTEDYFRKRAVEEAQKTDAELEAEAKKMRESSAFVESKRDEYLKKLTLPKELADEATLVPFLGSWLDERKEQNLHGNHYLVLFLREVGRRFNFDLKEVYYYTPGEIERLVMKGTRVTSGEISKRRRCLVYVVTGEEEEETIYSGDVAEEVLRLFEAKTDMTKQHTEIKGIVASQGTGGVLTGKVRVIVDLDGADFDRGDILVSTMTRPEFVSLMKLSSCIITDEGGIACHAAIVSRELGLPCIIGTKIGTGVLKDGDLVEVDADKGVVKTLKHI